MYPRAESWRTPAWRQKIYRRRRSLHSRSLGLCSSCAPFEGETKTCVFFSRADLCLSLSSVVPSFRRSPSPPLAAFLKTFEIPCCTVGEEKYTPRRGYLKKRREKLFQRGRAVAVDLTHRCPGQDYTVPNFFATYSLPPSLRIFTDRNPNAAKPILAKPKKNKNSGSSTSVPARPAPISAKDHSWTWGAFRVSCVLR